MSAASRQVRRQWARRHGVHPSRACGTDPIAWLRGQRTRRHGPPPGWLRHCSRWTKRGRPFAVVSWPVELTAEDYAELDELTARRFGVTVAWAPSWHGSGEARMVIVRPPR